MLGNEGPWFRPFTAGQPVKGAPEHAPDPDSHQSPILSRRDRVISVIVESEHGFTGIHGIEERGTELDGTDPALRGIRQPLHHFVGERRPVR